MKYWDVERPRFRIESGPKWLRIDEFTGELSGTPAGTGKSPVVVSVTLQREQRDLDPAVLQWGIEKVTSTRLVDLGSATQSFVIESQ
jgi:hypothetical protein